MEITEVRIKLMEEPGERLKAFCSITFDNCFVVRDLKIIDGSSGPFVAMPSRKLTSHCPKCRTKNHLRAQYCNQCGANLTAHRLPTDHDGRAKLYADIAHPINSACRELIQAHVISEYHEEIERAKQPGYISRYDDFDVDIEESPGTPSAPETRVDKAHEEGHPHSSPSKHEGTQTPFHAPLKESPKSQNSDNDFGAGIFSKE